MADVPASPALSSGGAGYTKTSSVKPTQRRDKANLRGFDMACDHCGCATNMHGSLEQRGCLVQGEWCLVAGGPVSPELSPVVC